MELIPDPDPDEEGTKISVCDYSYYTLCAAFPSVLGETVYVVIIIFR